MKTRTVLLLILIAFVIGFGAGRWTTKPETVIEYVKGETIRDTLYIPQPYEVEVPKYVTLPVKRDTIRVPGKDVVIVERVDTAAIINEYTNINKYAFTVFDTQEHGKLDINQRVQFNKLQHFDYSYTPVTRVETITRGRYLIPYVAAGVVNMNGVTGGSIGAGLFIGPFFGMEYRYIRDEFGGHGSMMSLIKRF